MDWRLIFDPPAPGSWNMALDEALLDAAGRSTGAGCLRFYGWSEPTVSLGYFQAYADRRQHLSSLDCALVRRATGGGAIIHDRELTYSLTLPVRNPLSSHLQSFYDVLHGTLVEELATHGVDAVRCSRGSRAAPQGCHAAPGQQPFLCFQRRCEGDVLLGPGKVAGSAQRRHRDAVLQHGSVLLARSRAAPELPGIYELRSVMIEPRELAGRWTERIGRRLGVRFVCGTATSGEHLAATRYQEEKFRYIPWTCRR